VVAAAAAVLVRVVVDSGDLYSQNRVDSWGLDRIGCTEAR
jgi:hypothetical protein